MHMTEKELKQFCEELFGNLEQSVKTSLALTENGAVRGELIFKLARKSSEDQVLIVRYLEKRIKTLLIETMQESKFAENVAQSKKDLDESLSKTGLPKDIQDLITRLDNVPLTFFKDADQIGSRPTLDPRIAAELSELVPALMEKAMKDMVETK